MVSPRAAPAIMAPDIERLHRTRASLATRPVGVGAGVAPGGLLGRLDDAQGRDTGDEGDDARAEEHDPHVVGPDDGPDQRTDGHAGDLGPVDGGEGPAASLDGDGARHHGQGGDGRRAGTEALQAAQHDGHGRDDGSQEGEAGQPVDDQATDEDGLAADPVGQAAQRVLEQHPGHEERGHDQSGQQVGAAEVADVDRQHGDDRRRARATRGRR